MLSLRSTTPRNEALDSISMLRFALAAARANLSLIEAGVTCRSLAEHWLPSAKRRRGRRSDRMWPSFPAPFISLCHPRCLILYKPWQTVKCVLKLSRNKTNLVYSALLILYYSTVLQNRLFKYRANTLSRDNEVLRRCQNLKIEAHCIPPPPPSNLPFPSCLYVNARSTPTSLWWM